MWIPGYWQKVLHNLLDGMWPLQYGGLRLEGFRRGRHLWKLPCPDCRNAETWGWWKLDETALGWRKSPLFSPMLACRPSHPISFLFLAICGPTALMIRIRRMYLLCIIEALNHISHTDVRPPHSVASRQVYKSITDPLASTGWFSGPTYIQWGPLFVNLAS